MASITAPLNAPVVSDDRIDRLRRFNLVMGVLHLVSGGFMLLVSNDFSLPVTSFATNGPPGTPLADGEMVEAFSYPLAVGTAGFLLLSAVAHLFVATLGAHGPDQTKPCSSHTAASLAG